MDNKNYNFTNCKWLWVNAARDEKYENIYTQYMDSFTITEEAQKILLHISADSEYVAWVNGKLAGYGQYADFPEYKVYDSLDITNLVNDIGEKNTLCILSYHQGRSTSVYKRGLPGVIYGVEQDNSTILHSSSSALCRIGTDYTSGNLPLTTPQLSFVFEYDFNGYDNWNQEGYEPAMVGHMAWGKAYAYENTQKFYPRPIKKLELGDRIESKIVAQGVYKYCKHTEPDTTAARMQFSYLSYRDAHALFGDSPCTTLPKENGLVFKNNSDEDDGIYVVLDLHREESGVFEIDITAPEGTVINVGYGEHLDDLRVRSYVGTRNFSGKLTASGKRDKFTHYIKRFGCRYIQLYVEAKEFTLYYAGLRPTNYPIEYKGYFSCSDSLHNKIYEISLRTLLLCMHEHYEDCPWREQALYAMDSRNQMLCGYYAFGEYDFARESIRLLGLSQREDGFLELCAPAEIPITIPCFTLMWIVQLYEHILFSGDLDFAQEMWKHVEQIIRSVWIHSRGSDLVPPYYNDKYWNFYEWSDGLSGDRALNNLRDKDNPLNFDAPLNAFYYLALRSAVQIAKNLADHTKDSNYRDLEAWYDMLAAGVLNSFDKTFWDEEKEVYATYIINDEKQHYSELANSLALYAGLVPESKKEKVAKALVGGKDLVPITISHSIFKYEALLSVSEEYAKYVFDEITDKWGYMLYNNATTFWETINGAWDFSNAGSLCHGWSAIPVIFYYKYVLGISPLTVGFADYKFSPVPTPLYAAEGKIPSGKMDYLVSITPNGFKINKIKH